MASVRTLNSAKSFTGPKPTPKEPTPPKKPAPKAKAATSSTKTTAAKKAAPSKVVSPASAELPSLDEISKFQEAMEVLIDTWKNRNTISASRGNQLVNGAMPDITRIFEKYGSTVLSAPQPAPAAPQEPAPAKEEASLPQPAPVAPQEPAPAKEEPVLNTPPAEVPAPAPAATQPEFKNIELDTAAGRIEILIRVS